MSFAKPRIDRRNEARPLFLTTTFLLTPLLGALGAALSLTGHQVATGWAETALRLVPAGILLLSISLMALVMDRLFDSWAEIDQKVTSTRPRKRHRDPWSTSVSLMFILGFGLQVLALR